MATKYYQCTVDARSPYAGSQIRVQFHGRTRDVHGDRGSYFALTPGTVLSVDDPLAQAALSGPGMTDEVMSTRMFVEVTARAIDFDLEAHLGSRRPFF